jgi:hypothetical protein
MRGPALGSPRIPEDIRWRYFTAIGVASSQTLAHFLDRRFLCDFAERANKITR